jgi:hypothetical protein
LTAALTIAHEVLGLGVAARLLDRLPRLAGWQRTVLRGLEPGAVSRLDGAGDRIRAGSMALLMDRWSDAIRCVGPCLLPKRQYVAAACPGPWTRLPGGAHLAYLFRGLSRLARTQLAITPVATR